MLTKIKYKTKGVRINSLSCEIYRDHTMLVLKVLITWMQNFNFYFKKNEAYIFF